MCSENKYVVENLENLKNVDTVIIVNEPDMFWWIEYAKIKNIKIRIWKLDRMVIDWSKEQ